MAITMVVHGLSCGIDVAISDGSKEDWKHNHKIGNFLGRYKYKMVNRGVATVQ